MKRALVTGGTRGIGLAVCRMLQGEGYFVTALYSRSEEDAAHARALLPEVRFVRVDVSSEEDVRALFAEIPRLDVLVNNAGISCFGQVQDTPLSAWEHVMAVNAGGTFLCTKYAVPKMLSAGGAIVNISSVWGSAGGSCESAYSASKGAVIAFTKALARELAPAGITVNSVLPGVIDTAMNARFAGEERAALEGEIPLGRFGTPEEVAEAVRFFLKCGYATGQTLGVDGGFC